jgi:hypothetical protein
MIMASPQNTLKLTQTNPYTTQNQNLDGVFRGALDMAGAHLAFFQSETWEKLWSFQGKNWVKTG